MIAGLICPKHRQHRTHSVQTCMGCSDGSRSGKEHEWSWSSGVTAKSHLIMNDSLFGATAVLCLLGFWYSNKNETNTVWVFRLIWKVVCGVLVLSLWCLQSLPYYSILLLLLMCDVPLSCSHSLPFWSWYKFVLLIFSKNQVLFIDCFLDFLPSACFRLVYPFFP